VVLSSTSLLEQNIVPKSLIIAGGGTIGVEMADFYYHMGTHVIIAEAAPQLAPTEDEDIAAHLRYTLEKHGVLCLVGVRAESLEEDEDGNARLTLADGATYTAEKGLIAAGRMPNTEHLDAENAGCALNRRGFITTDYYLQSSPNSWAIGDVNGKMLFAHAATHQGEYVARTILGLEFSPYQAGPCPYCLHGSMEIMHVGLTEREAAALGGEILVSKSLFSSNVISQARGDASGFVKVVWRNGEMAGIAAIGGCATQLTLSAELLLMGQYSGSRLNSFMVAHPTLDETLVDAVKAPRRPSEY
jgi:dihydrolipoamide dehydrogenase